MDATPRGELAAKRAVEWLRVLADTWVNADVAEARADRARAIYDRIVAKGRSIVAARLTPAAYANGLALALPQVVMARPEGFGRAGTTSVPQGQRMVPEAHPARTASAAPMASASRENPERASLRDVQRTVRWDRVDC
jgi:hypothetical protein